MRQLICWDMISVDGYFEGPNQNISWFAFDDELEQYILDTQRSAGTLLFGRRTYDGMVAYWPDATGEIAEFMNRVPKVVVSDTLQHTDWSPTTIVRGSELPEAVEQLKREPGETIFVFGSAQLTATLLRYGLVDELRLGVNPILLGSGRRLFADSGDRQPLRLVKSVVLSSGLAILHYRTA